MPRGRKLKRGRCQNGMHLTAGRPMDAAEGVQSRLLCPEAAIPAGEGKTPYARQVVSWLSTDRVINVAERAQIVWGRMGNFPFWPVGFFFQFCCCVA